MLRHASLRAYLSLSSGRPDVAPRPRCRLHLEALEDRFLLALSVPAWVPQDPTAINDVSGTPILGNGAVQTVAIDPTNANRIFAAAVEGGIWATSNGTSASPTWTPLTDNKVPFLGTTDIEFDPTDPSRNTLWAATGRFSNNGVQNGPAVGLYLTTTAGAKWTQAGQATFTALNISNVIPTTVKDPVTGQQVILVSTQQTPFAGGNSYGTQGPAGVYRSADAGKTWTRISGAIGTNGVATGLPAGDVWQMIGDPADPQRFYAGVTLANKSGGIFVSVTAGATWSEVAGDAKLTRTPLGNVSGIKLAVHNDPQNNVLYAGVVNQAGDLSAVLRSASQGTDWTRMDLPGDPVKSVNPGDQGPGNDALVADPVSPNIVFVAGDQGSLFRGDAGLSAGSATTPQWTSITGAAQANAAGVIVAGANGTVPHPDSRSMIFDAAGNLLETDDGGIFRLSSPNDPTRRQWTFLSGNMAVNAANFVSYDSVNHTVFGGSQDNGTPTQAAQDNLIHSDASSGDGQFSAVDNTSMPGFSIHYTSAQKGSFFRTIFNGAGNAVGAQAYYTAAVLPLTVVGAGKVLKEVDKTIPFGPPLVVNAVDGTRLLLATNYLYESFDRGNTLVPLLGLNADGTPKGDVGKVSALAYGGRLNGQNVPDVAYVGTDGSGKDVKESAAAAHAKERFLQRGFQLPRRHAVEHRPGSGQLADRLPCG